MAVTIQTSRPVTDGRQPGRSVEYFLQYRIQQFFILFILLMRQGNPHIFFLPAL